MRFYILVCLFLLLSHTSKSQSADTTLIYRWVQVLASDSLEGRLTSSVGGAKAASFLYTEFKKLGLIGEGKGGFHSFEVITGLQPGEMNYICLGACPAEIGQDFMPASFSASADAEVPLIDAGYGFRIETDSLRYNDYEGKEVKGKIVLIRQGMPKGNEEQAWMREHAGDREKVMLAIDQGAVGVVIMMSANKELPPLRYDKVGTSVSVPVVYVTESIGNCLVENQSVKDLRLQVSLEPIKAQVNNVWGVWEGTDPLLKDEYIVIGAHYDHLGWGGAGSGSRMPDTVAIHYGADDNASGVAGLAAVVSYLRKHALKIRRSLVFVAFTGEEEGLLGSAAFMASPPIAKDKIVAMINFDMIGRLNRQTQSISIGGTGTGVESQAILDSLLALLPLKASYSPEGFGPSDHASFYAQNIPVFYFNSGIHTDYHTPFDRPEKINYAGIMTLGEVGARLAVSLANRSRNLTFQEAGPKTRGNTRQGLKVTLGIMPDFTASDIKGLKVAGVTPGGPASLAGMQKGDIIVAMDGKPVGDIYEYMNRLKLFRKGQRVNVDILRNGDRAVVVVEL